MSDTIAATLIPGRAIGPEIVGAMLAAFDAPQAPLSVPVNAVIGVPWIGLRALPRPFWSRRARQPAGAARAV
jgi:hypothetical protein